MKARILSIFLFALPLVAGAADLSGKDFESHFLSKLHDANQKEIALGKLALQKGQSPQVKQFGAKLVKDHTDADQRVQALAKDNGVDLSKSFQPINDEERSEMHQSQQVANHLQKARGADFDRTFKAAMVTDHKKDIKEVSESIDKLPNQNTKDFARNLVPVLQEHERIASNLPSPNATS